MALNLIVAILVTWRITILLVYEWTGQPVRDLAKTYAVGEDGCPTTYWGKVLNCFWCCSIWVGVIITPLAISNAWWILWPVAASGGAILLNHLVRMYLYVERE